MAKKEIEKKIEVETPHKTIKSYRHRGIEVKVLIDFDTQRISLLENGTNGINAPKRWVFAEREIGYMPAWQTILDAMKLAIERASGELNVEMKRRALQDELDDF